MRMLIPFKPTKYPFPNTTPDEGNPTPAPAHRHARTVIPQKLHHPAKVSASHIAFPYSGIEKKGIGRCSRRLDDLALWRQEKGTIAKRESMTVRMRRRVSEAKRLVRR